MDEMLVGKKPEFHFTDESLMGKLQIKLKRLYEIMNDKTERSIQDQKQMQSLISDISHQVKTPVANLKMFGEILLERQLSEEQRKEFLLLLLGQMNKLDFLMQALVKTSRLENGIVTLVQEKINVEEILTEALSQVMTNAEQKNIDIKVTYDNNLIVLCDKKWTVEAIFNILDNAVKYTPENGHITVCVEKNEFYVKFSIADDGPCIPESEQTLIFKRFYRSESVKDMEGVGIGLFLARQIITEQGGFIQVKSNPPKGVEFQINLIHE